MHIDRDTIENLLDFVDKFPHYFIGCNAPLERIGGSVLAHDHYQGGGEALPLHKANIRIKIMDKKYTDMPCIQFYSGGQLNNVKGKSGTYNRYAGFCLEPQYCPNAINMDGFENPYLKAYEIKNHFILYNISSI